MQVKVDAVPERDRTTVHRGSRHLQSLLQVPETGDATFGFDEFESDCRSPTVAPVGQHRHGVCDILVMYLKKG